LVLRLFETLDAGECKTPLDSKVLEKLANGRLASRAAQKARDHIAQCVYCLNAYAEVQSILEMPTPAEAIQEEAETRPARVTTAATRGLFDQVRELISTIEREVRQLRHRAVQTEYSDPGLHAYASLALMDVRSMPMSGSEESFDELVSRLQTARRSLEEQLSQVMTFTKLIEQHEQLATQLQAAKMESVEKRRLLGELSKARVLLGAALPQLSRRLKV
jgi:hypothetical protein